MYVSKPLFTRVFLADPTPSSLSKSYDRQTRSRDLKKVEL